MLGSNIDVQTTPNKHDLCSYIIIVHVWIIEGWENLRQAA